MIKRLLTSVAVLLLFLGRASAQYPGWQHSGSLWILTTPEGANLPATASEKDFPLLIRLDKETFDFSQAKAHGEDIRFSAVGKPMAYQIEEWDAAKGSASIWVRIPLIKGNARQEIKLHWGKANAASESNGSEVFNESNGYATVMHLSDPLNSVKDEVGTLNPVNVGGLACRGMIGQGLNFKYGRGGVIGGEKITNYPAGNSPSSTEFWFKDNEKPGPWGSRFVSWGIEGYGSKLLVGALSPLHIQAGMDCPGSIALGKWYHVAHTHSASGPDKGMDRAYVNGRLVASAPNVVNFKSPTRMYIAGWWRNWESDCDVDEVRISKVARSADWVKLEYENQQPQQTLVGTLSQPGNAFSVSTSAIQLDEGKCATVTAQAGGAQKVYWMLKHDGVETTVGVDQFSHTFAAGRVVGDVSYVLQFKAVYADEVKTRDIAVIVKEAIPEPLFTLHAPTNWNGRDTIEVTPMFSNLKAMQDRGAADLHYQWTVSGGAVIKKVVPGKLILNRSQYTGPITVKVVIDNGGSATIASTEILVTEPKSDPWVERTPAKDEKPEDNQFYARNDNNVGILDCNGTLEKPADSLFLKIFADDKLLETLNQKPSANKIYAFAVKLKPGLIKYRMELGAKSGGTETILHKAGNIVCGDAYLIDGQSNALATDTGEQSPPDTSDWIRSYGSPAGDPKDQRQNRWCNPVWKAQKGEKDELGWWGMELAKRLVQSRQIPIFVINGAVGGTRIDQHLRNEANHSDLNTIYGRMLWRVENARLTHGIRAVLWHQGESDQGTAGPGGGYGWESYRQYFVDMSAAWKQDFPNIRRYYIYQIWPNSCSMGGGHGDMMREVQRTLPRLYSNMDVMSTLGIKPAGPCHYPLTGWSEFARLIQPLIERDMHGKKVAESITAADLKKVYYTSAAKDAIALEFDQPVVWTDSLASQFYLDGAADKGISGSIAGKVVMLKLRETSTAKKITYLKEMNWSQDKLLWGTNGIAALTFCDVDIVPPPSGQ